MDSVLPQPIIAGLPWTAWLLLLLTIGLPLAIELRFFWAHRSRASSKHEET